jgi:hypothetical protein
LHRQNILSPVWGDRKSTREDFFRPSWDFVGLGILPTAVAVGYYRALLRSLKPKQLQTEFEMSLGSYK